MSTSAAQDPNELFDIVRADGSPTGRTKPRALVHRDGDWHRSLHVWVAGKDATGDGYLLFQQRGLDKDTWPGRLDATVGGHLRAGETLAGAFREVQEEIGIAVETEKLRQLGTRHSISEEEDGILDHEIQSLFLLRDDQPLTAYRPDPAELAALVRCPLSVLLAFFVGDTMAIDAMRIVPGGEATAPVTITTADFIPTIDGYFYRVAIAAGMALRGERHVAV